MGEDFGSKLQEPSDELELVGDSAKEICEADLGGERG